MNGISQWDWPREESRPNSPAKHLKAEYYSRKKKEEKFQALNPSNGQFKRQNRTLSKIPGQQQTRVLGIEAGKNARVHLLIFSQDPNLIPKLTNFPPKKKIGSNFAATNQRLQAQQQPSERQEHHY